MGLAILSKTGKNRVLIPSTDVEAIEKTLTNLNDQNRTDIRRNATKKIEERYSFNKIFQEEVELCQSLLK